MEARRIKTVLFFIASIFLFSCERKEDNRLALIALQTACKNEWAAIEEIARITEAATYKGGNRQLDRHVLSQSKRIASWKKYAIPKLSTSGLKQYADSLIFWNNVEKNRPYSLFFDTNNPASSVLRNIQSGRIEVPTKLNTQADSLHYYELLYLLLLKESEFQGWLSQKILVEDFSRSSTSKVKYAVNDTVKLIIPFSIYHSDESIHYRAKSLQVTHQRKPTNIVPSVEIIGKYVILKFIAQQKGTYIVNGIITNTYPESNKEELTYSINEHITVE